MDLRTLRAEAIKEANTELRDEKIENFKVAVRNTIYNISQNNEKICRLQELNNMLKETLATLELDEFVSVSFDPKE